MLSKSCIFSGHNTTVSGKRPLLSKRISIPLSRSFRCGDSDVAVAGRSLVLALGLAGDVKPTATNVQNLGVSLMLACHARQTSDAFHKGCRPNHLCTSPSSGPPGALNEIAPTASVTGKLKANARSSGGRMLFMPTLKVDFASKFTAVGALVECAIWEVSSTAPDGRGLSFAWLEVGRNERNQCGGGCVVLCLTREPCAGCRKKIAGGESVR